MGLRIASKFSRRHENFVARVYVGGDFLSYCVCPPPRPFGAVAFSGRIILQKPARSAFEKRILSTRQVKGRDTCKDNFKIVARTERLKKSRSSCDSWDPSVGYPNEQYPLF